MHEPGYLQSALLGMRRDAVMLQHRYGLAAQGPVAFTVVDSLLLAHQVSSGAVHIFDVVANASQAVAPPMPLSLLQPGVQFSVPLRFLPANSLPTYWGTASAVT